MHRKNHIKIYQTTTSFYSKKDLKLIKQFFSSEKMSNSNNCIYIMLTRPSERIFNSMCYTDVLIFLWRYFESHSCGVLLTFPLQNFVGCYYFWKNISRRKKNNHLFHILFCWNNLFSSFNVVKERKYIFRFFLLNPSSLLIYD